MTKKALLIGINYTGSVALKGCINDVNNISKVLQANCKFGTVKVLTDSTKDVMVSGIKWLVSNNKPGDILVFYYSGHGTTMKDTDGDEMDGKDEVLVPFDYKTNGVLTDDWLYANLASKVTGGVTLWGFTDCCHSGTMCDLKYNYVPKCTVKAGKPRVPYSSVNWTDVFTMSLQRKDVLIGNVIFISGCLDNQVSLETNGQGAFTKCFISFLNLKPLFINNTVKLCDLLKYLQCNLSRQVPQLSSCKMTTLDSWFNL